MAIKPDLHQSIVLHVQSITQTISSGGLPAALHSSSSTSLASSSSSFPSLPHAPDCSGPLLPSHEFPWEQRDVARQPRLVFAWLSGPKHAWMTLQALNKSVQFCSVHRRPGLYHPDNLLIFFHEGDGSQGNTSSSSVGEVLFSDVDIRRHRQAASFTTVFSVKEGRDKPALLMFRCELHGIENTFNYLQAQHVAFFI